MDAQLFNFNTARAFVGFESWRGLEISDRIFSRPNPPTGQKGICDYRPRIVTAVTDGA